MCGNAVTTNVIQDVFERIDWNALYYHDLLGDVE